MSVADSVAAVTAGLAAAGVLWGVYQYRKGQITQRQGVLFQVIKEFNEPHEMILAKEILGYGYVRHLKDCWEKDLSYYSKDNLGTILRNHREQACFGSR